MDAVASGACSLSVRLRVELELDAGAPFDEQTMRVIADAVEAIISGEIRRIKFHPTALSAAGNLI